MNTSKFTVDHFVNGAFTWFTGVVEDRDDPLRMGRVRVRCFGFHTESKTFIKTEDLPWATVLLPTTGASISGFGHTPHALYAGSWVVGFFRDGPSAQDPIIIGSIASMYEEKPDNEKGFADPSGYWPTYIKEPDVNRRAVANEEKVHPIVEKKLEKITKEVPQANETGSWDELEIRAETKYPYNKVYETESGHMVEFDDTDGQERIQEYHKSGTFYEIDSDGNKVTRIVKDQYEIVAGNNFVNIKGNCNLTVDSNCTTYIKGNWDIQVDGNVNTHIKGNVTELVNGNVSETVNGNVTEKYDSNQTTTVANNVTETFGGNQRTKISGNLDVDASRIDLN